MGNNGAALSTTQMKQRNSRVYRFLMVIFFSTLGCTAGQSISEDAVQQKLAKIKIGFTTQNDIENLFGKPNVTENGRWMYSLSDAALDIANIRGPIPVMVATMPTNTRALIAVKFNEAAIVNALEIERFFKTPFVNEYSYFLERITDRTLESASSAGEMSNFRVADFDKTVGGFLLLENGASDARIIVKLDNQILHITSINPYERTSSEYRVFRRREGQFIKRIFASIGTDGNTSPWR